MIASAILPPAGRERLRPIRLPYRDHTFIRIISSRTGETLFELKMLDGSIIERVHVNAATLTI